MSSVGVIHNPKGEALAINYNNGEQSDHSIRLLQESTHLGQPGEVQKDAKIIGRRSKDVKLETASTLHAAVEVKFKSVPAKTSTGGIPKSRSLVKLTETQARSSAEYDKILELRRDKDYIRRAFNRPDRSAERDQPKKRTPVKLNRPNEFKPKPKVVTKSSDPQPVDGLDLVLKNTSLSEFKVDPDVFGHKSEVKGKGDEIVKESLRKQQEQRDNENLQKIYEERRKREAKEQLDKLQADIRERNKAKLSTDGRKQEYCWGSDQRKINGVEDLKKRKVVNEIRDTRNARKRTKSESERREMHGLDVIPEEKRQKYLEEAQKKRQARSMDSKSQEAKPPINKPVEFKKTKKTDLLKEQIRKRKEKQRAEAIRKLEEETRRVETLKRIEAERKVERMEFEKRRKEKEALEAKERKRKLQQKRRAQVFTSMDSSDTEDFGVSEVQPRHDESIDDTDMRNEQDDEVAEVLAAAEPEATKSRAPRDRKIKESILTTGNKKPVKSKKSVVSRVEPSESTGNEPSQFTNAYMRVGSKESVQKSLDDSMSKVSFDLSESRPKSTLSTTEPRRSTLAPRTKSASVPNTKTAGGDAEKKPEDTFNDDTDLGPMRIEDHSGIGLPGYSIKEEAIPKNNKYGVEYDHSFAKSAVMLVNDLNRQQSQDATDEASQAMTKYRQKAYELGARFDLVKRQREELFGQENENENERKTSTEQNVGDKEDQESEYTDEFHSEKDGTYSQNDFDEEHDADQDSIPFEEDTGLSISNSLNELNQDIPRKTINVEQDYDEVTKNHQQIYPGVLSVAAAVHKLEREEDQNVISAIVMIQKHVRAYLARKECNILIEKRIQNYDDYSDEEESYLVAGGENDEDYDIIEKQKGFDPVKYSVEKYRSREELRQQTAVTSSKKEVKKSVKPAKMMFSNDKFSVIGLYAKMNMTELLGEVEREVSDVASVDTSVKTESAAQVSMTGAGKAIVKIDSDSSYEKVDAVEASSYSSHEAAEIKTTEEAGYTSDEFDPYGSSSQSKKLTGSTGGQNLAASKSSSSGISESQNLQFKGSDSISTSLGRSTSPLGLSSTAPFSSTLFESLSLGDFASPAKNK